jgi:hypothetical protein
VNSQFPAEWIEWYDHCSLEGGGWRDMNDWDQLGPLRIVSLGFVVRETDEIVVIVPHYTDDDKGCGDMCILKANIISRRPLEVE